MRFFFCRIRKWTIRKLAKSLTKQSSEEMQQIRAGRALWQGGERGPAGGAQPRAAPRSAAQAGRCAPRAGQRAPRAVLRPAIPSHCCIFAPRQLIPRGKPRSRGWGRTRPRNPSVSRGCGRAQGRGGGCRPGSPPAPGTACPAEIPTSAHLSPKRAKRQLPVHPRRVHSPFGGILFPSHGLGEAGWRNEQVPCWYFF